MSYDRMEQRAAELEAEVQRWLSAAEAADAEEDKAIGANKSGEELPDWVAKKKKRAEKISLDDRPVVAAQTPPGTPSLSTTRLRRDRVRRRETASRRVSRRSRRELR
jgi:hypothetical protein